MTDEEMEQLRVVGTCTRLEKDYFRLTSAPDPATVRPEAVLRNALVLLKEKWEAEEAEYVYMCNQLKSLRQDLTVQHIQNGECSDQMWQRDVVDNLRAYDKYRQWPCVFLQISICTDCNCCVNLVHLNLAVAGPVGRVWSRDSFLTSAPPSARRP